MQKQNPNTNTAQVALQLYPSNGQGRFESASGRLEQGAHPKGRTRIPMDTVQNGQSIPIVLESSRFNATGTVQVPMFFM